jgi:hypothetical protein
MLSPTAGGIVAGLLVWILWAGLGLMAFLAFIRGMRALTEIARRLARIEHLLDARMSGATDRR